MTRRTLIFLYISFPLGLQLQEDLNRKVDFSSLTELYMDKLNATLTCLSWLYFFPILTYILSSERKFYVISLMILCNSGTSKEIQVHRPEEYICFQIFHVKYHLPSCENMEAAISQSVLGVSKVGSPLQFYL